MRLFFGILLLLTNLGFAAPVVMQAPVEFTASPTSTQAMAADPDRKYLVIQNKGGTSIIVKFGSAHSASEGIAIGSGGNWEMAAPPIDAVYIKSVSGTPGVTLQGGK